MSTGGVPPETPAADSGRRSLMHRLRNYFLTGLLIAGPLFLTIYFAWAFIEWADSWVTPFIPKVFGLDAYLPYSVPGFGLVVALVFITILGFLTANLVGRTLIVWGESMLGRMPLIRNIYRGLKQLFETALATSKPFKTVVLVEFPRKGMWAIAFLIGEVKGEVRDRLKEGGDDDFVSIFIPTAHITGYTAFVRRREVIVLDTMSAEDAAKLVISAGLVGPEASTDLTGGKPISLAEAARRVRAEPNRRG